MKDKFLNDLRLFLQNKNVSDKDCDEIVKDYKEFYEEYLQRNYTDEQIYEKFGTFDEIYINIEPTIKKRQIEKKWQKKLISITPLLSVIIFISVGVLANKWHPTWLIFLSVPISGVLFNGKKLKYKIMGVLPLLLVITYILIGTIFKVWHPTWLIFLFIPAINILLAD